MFASVVLLYFSGFLPQPASFLCPVLASPRLEMLPVVLLSLASQATTRVKCGCTHFPLNDQGNDLNFHNNQTEYGNIIHINEHFL